MAINVMVTIVMPTIVKAIIVCGGHHPATGTLIEYYTLLRTGGATRVGYPHRMLKQPVQQDQD